MQYEINRKIRMEQPLFKVINGTIEGTDIQIELSPDDVFMSRKLGFLLGRVIECGEEKSLVETTGFIQTGV